jgi:hypothetical protein
MKMKGSRVKNSQESEDSQIFGIKKLRIVRLPHILSATVKEKLPLSR